MRRAPQGSPLIQGTINPAPGPRRSRRLLRARIHPTALTPREALRRPLSQFGFVAAIFASVLGLGFFPIQVPTVTTTPSVQAARLSLPGLAAVAAAGTSDALVSRAVPLTLVAPATNPGDGIVRPAEAVPRNGEPTPAAGAEGDIVRAAAAQQNDRVPVFFEYKVQAGDTVSGVASRFGIRSTYITWNNADVTNANALAVGQTLQVPSVEGIIHSVRLGETVSEIALRYDANAQDIIEFRANGLQGDPNRLREGSQILVPGGRKVEIAATIAPPRTPAAAVAAATTAPPRAGTPAAAVSANVVVPNSAWAWPVRGLLTSPFGPSHPLGIDVAIPVGTPIVAAAAGTVIFVGGNPCCSYGYHIIIDNGAGYETTYAHLSGFAVQKGDKVAAGQRIGTSGNSGNSTGPHLHFELHRGGRVQDPMQYLP
ncbi:MAG: peptidoglycan DD-metalloendopeptidase family protein [Dehalococcoidia bacterium]